MRNILEMKGITKSFPGVRALDKVDFSCFSGEVHALVGENGAGKSTLMKILAGAYHQDEGEIWVKGKEMNISSPRDAQRYGISIIYQEFNLIPDLNVAQNVFLGREPKRRGFIDTGSIHQRTEALLSELGVKIDPYVKAKNLSVAEQQMVEVAKALSLNADMIIMDEPTRGIDVGAKAEIYDLMRRLASQDTGIMMISSELPEIIGMSDRVVVMHEGQIAGELSPEEATEEKILTLATGQIETMH